MSVSSVDRSKDERVRQTREESDEREASLMRRKNSELQRAEKRHQAELQRLKEEFSKQIESIKSGNSDSITERDQKNNQKIESMRNIYTGQLRKKMEDAQSEKSTLRETYESEMGNQKKVSTRQREALERKQGAELQNRDGEFAELSQKTQGKLKEAITSNHEKLTAAHEKEKAVLRGDREMLVGKKEFEKEQLKQNFKSEQARQGRELGNKSEYWQAKYKDEVARGNESTNEDLRIRNETMRQAVGRNSERFQNKIQEKEDSLHDANENFKDQANQRINDQVRSRSSEINRLKNSMTSMQANGNKQKEIEKGHIVDAYERQLSIVEDQKKNMKGEFLELAHDRTNKILRKQTDTSRDAQRDFKSQINLVETRGREDRRNLISTHGEQIEYVKQQADKRVDKLARIREDNEARLGDYYDENLNVLKDNYHQKVVDQRDASIGTLNDVSQNMMKRFRNMENTYQGRIEKLEATLQNKINSMQDNHDKEMHRISTVYDQRMNEREKGFKTEKKSLEQKYENKIALMQEQNEDKIDRLGKRHEEDMKTVTAKANYSRKV